MGLIKGLKHRTKFGEKEKREKESEKQEREKRQFRIMRGRWRKKK